MKLRLLGKFLKNLLIGLERILHQRIMKIGMIKSDGKLLYCHHILLKRKFLRDMVRSLTGMQYETRFDLMGMKNPSNVMLVVNSSDRFQGQEADIVLMSLRNGSRIGFLDSPSRMNVALTRAREMRIVVGKS